MKASEHPPRVRQRALPLKLSTAVSLMIGSVIGAVLLLVYALWYMQISNATRDGLKETALAVARTMADMPQVKRGLESYTSSFDLAQTCVFGKQLLGPILCGSISGAPLLPKLRGQFAEFLNNPSPVGLRIFFLPTCVGLRYGHRRNTHSFSRHLPSRTSVLTSLDRYRNQHPAPRLQMCPCA